MRVNETTKNQTNELRGSLAKKTAFALTKIILAHPVTFMKNRKMSPDEQRYVRHPRQYELPSFQKGMKYPTSNEPYFRPTRWCNPREPEVVALANELGAYELSDREFAEAAYWFVKDKIRFEMLAFDSAGATLKRGTGTCMHYISLFNALCRAAEIKARYKLFAINYDRYGSDGGSLPDDPLWKDLYNALGYVMSEAEAEVYLDGEWTVAYPVSSAELEAAGYKPILKLGEDTIGIFYDTVPGTIRRVEAIPAEIEWAVNILRWLSPASLERVSITVQLGEMHGQQVIAEAGGREAYDRMARERLKRSSPTIEAKGNTALVFEE